MEILELGKNITRINNSVDEFKSRFTTERMGKVKNQRKTVKKTVEGKRPEGYCENV